MFVVNNNNSPHQQKDHQDLLYVENITNIPVKILPTYAITCLTYCMICSNWLTSDARTKIMII